MKAVPVNHTHVSFWHALQLSKTKVYLTCIVNSAVLLNEEKKKFLHVEFWLQSGTAEYDFNYSLSPGFKSAALVKARSRETAEQKCTSVMISHTGVAVKRFEHMMFVAFTSVKSLENTRADLFYLHFPFWQDVSGKQLAKAGKLEMSCIFPGIQIPSSANPFLHTVCHENCPHGFWSLQLG